MRILREIILCCVMASLLSSCAMLGGGKVEGVKGETFFTKVNIWFPKNKKAVSTNLHQGDILPAGTEVNVVSAGLLGIKFTVDSDEVYTLRRVEKYCSISLDELFKRYFGKADITSTTGMYVKFTPEEKDNIDIGIISDGMTKESVLMAYGFPPTHKTPLLTSDVWYYWVGRNRVEVYFENDKVKKIIGVQVVRAIKIYAVSDPPGAVINMDGQIQGHTPCIMEINVAVKDRKTRVFQAVPSVPELPRLGVLCDTPPPAESLVASPIVIREVIPLSSGYKLGLIPGDKILAVNSIPIKNELDCMQAFHCIGFGKSITMRINRGGTELDLKGETERQEKGSFYTKEEHVSPESLVEMDGKVMFFNLRTADVAPITPVAKPRRGSRLARKPVNQPAEKRPTVDLPMAGTGFVLGSGGYVITCASLIKNAERIVLLSSDGKKHSASVVNIDEVNDWCLLKASSLSEQGILIAPDSSISTGSKVYHIGYPIGKHIPQLLQTGSGRIANLKGFGGDNRHLQLHTAGTMGNISGSPLLDEHGRLVGIVSDKLNDIIHMFAGTAKSARENMFVLKASVIKGLLPANVVLTTNASKVSSEILDEGSVKARLTSSIVVVYAK